MAAKTTSVTLSLPALIEELKQHVSADKGPALDKLVQQAHSPDQQVQVKQQLGQLVTQQDMRAAVNALIDRQSVVPSASTTPRKEAAPAAAPDSEGIAAPLGALFGNMSKEDFRASLIHAFHCRTPSCPVPGCADMSAKLERLHQHVTSCNTTGCVLCRMWTYLKYYRDTTVGSGMQMNSGICHAMYVEPLLQSQQLLPRWQNGKISWVPPTDALKQIHELTSGVPAEGAAPAEGGGGEAGEGRRASKRQKTPSSRAAAASAADAPSAAMPPPWNTSLPGFPAAAGLQAAAWQYPGAGAADVVRTMLPARGGGGRSMAPPLSAAGVGGLHQLSAAWLHGAGAGDVGVPLGGLAAVRSSSLLDELASWPESDFDTQMMGTIRQMASEATPAAGGATPNLAGLPLVKEQSGLSLSELIKLRSTSDLNLSFTNSRELRQKNFSEMSFGSVLENAAGDLNDILPEF